ncbi:MAG: D-glycerate dehydrogenase [Deltaproteobacteria bacterium]|nr:MAG: D-glycerate dehydrogenase [Deltaproteobacteria bacterium]
MRSRAPHRPRVFVTRALPGTGLERLAARTHLEVWPAPGGPSYAELVRGARDADALLCMLTDRVDAALLGACTRLRVVSSCSVGLDHVDLAEATRRGIPVGHTPGVLAETTADLAFALLLATARRVAEADRFVRSGGWTPERRWEPELLLGRDVHGAVLGSVGLGQIGRAMARRAAGFGMRVLGWSRSRRRVAGVERVALEDLLAGSDAVTIHLALTPETRGLLDARALARMKPEAFLINTARGGIVDEAALAEALAAGRLAGAGIDVFESEPLAPSSPLLALENVVLTPHIGSASIATRVRMADLAVENVLAGLAARALPHCANPEVQPASATRSRRR